jgi:cellobiose phosphorylase
MNWVLIEGLCRYGYWDVARQLALKTAEMAVASGEPTCRENYHPFGEGHHRKFGHNIFNYGWGGISADIILRRLMGIQPRAADDTLCLDPLFPQEWTHGAVDDIHVSVHKVAWEIQRSNGKLSGQLIHSGARPLKVVTALGEFTADNNELQIPLDDGKHLKEHWLDWLES